MTIINSVIAQGGIQPSGTIQITTNGIHDVTNYATADVQVPTTAPALYREFQLYANGVLVPNTTTTHIMDFTGVKNVSEYALYKAYYGNTAISGIVDMSDLTTVGAGSACYNMFQGCTGLASVDLSSLTTVGAGSACYSMFQGCTGLTSVDLSSLTTVGGNNACYSMFQGCTGLTSVDLPSLTTVASIGGGNNALNALTSMFQGCTGLTSVDLPSLTTVSGSAACRSMFSNCANLTRLSFYALTPTSFGIQTNLFNNMLSGVTGCTVHFPMAIQSTIGSWSDVTSGFGGTNTVVLFDIVTSLTGADTNTYTRSQKNSTSTATAWTYNNTLYYTSGTTEPVVNDTIYSDSTCTTAVTTISAIA